MIKKTNAGLKSALGFIEVLVGFVLLVAFTLFLNSFFASRASQIANQPHQAGSQPPSPILTGQTDLTSGWKVYTSILNRYSINYPPDWNLEEIPNITFSSPNIEITSGGTVVAGGQVVIFESDHSSTEPLSEIYSNNSSSGLSTTERKDITIDNLPAIWYVASGEGIDGTMTGAMVISGNKLYRIEAYYGTKDTDRIRAVLELMLMSIRFASN